VVELLEATQLIAFREVRDDPAATIEGMLIPSTEKCDIFYVLP